MGNTAYCGCKNNCLIAKDGNVDFQMDDGGDDPNLATNMNTYPEETNYSAKAKTGNIQIIGASNDLGDMKDVGESESKIPPNSSSDSKKIGNEPDEQVLKFDVKLKQIGEFVDDSILDDILRNYIKESEDQLEIYKQNKTYNKGFGNLISRPLNKLNFDDSYYKGQWSMDLKRTGFGISIKSDGSRYQGTWLNDNVNGYGRFTNINGNYYEGKEAFS